MTERGANPRPSIVTELLESMLMLLPDAILRVWLKQKELTIKKIKRNLCIFISYNLT